MALPSSRTEFKEYCLRKLGKPVIEINVDDDQVDDRIDEALRYYWDYHFDGSDKQYYRYTVTTANFPDRVAEIKVVSGGTGYSNTDTVTITRATGDAEGVGATATLTTNTSGAIISINITANGVAAIAMGCCHLQSITLRQLPYVGDACIEALALNASSNSLRKLSRFASKRCLHRFVGTHNTLHYVNQCRSIRIRYFISTVCSHIRRFRHGTVLTSRSARTICGSRSGR
jgi:hypothetical protein